jgi:taurine dioxygenase
MDHTPLGPVGAELTGLAPRDLGALDPTTVEAIRDLLADRGVVVLRDAPLDDDAFLAFLSRFGALTFTQGETPVPGFPDLNVISNVGRTTPPRSTFHVDTSYVRVPPAYTALRAVSIPERGGQTLFTNQYRAYATLPAEVREHLEGRTIRHVVTGVDPGPGEETEAEHPVFRPHPRSGRIALYLTTPARCAGISGMTPDEAQETIAFLYAHSTAEENTLRHSWAPGDVVMWDNACVLHRADHADVVGDRVMHRGMVAG